MGQADSEPVRREYDRLAPEYDRRWGLYVEATLRAMLDAPDFEGHERVLDLACGTGELERRLLARWPGLRVLGADLSRGMLREAAAKKSAANTGWVQADAHRPPFADSRFDAVLCANSFHYFRAPAGSLATIRRVLRPDGRLMLVDWCDEEGARFGRSLFGSSAVSGAFVPDELRNLTDRDGVKLADAVKPHGIDLDHATDARKELKHAAAYLELHIEQGPVLESMSLPMGAVLGNSPGFLLNLRLHGRLGSAVADTFAGQVIYGVDELDLPSTYAAHPFGQILRDEPERILQLMQQRTLENPELWGIAVLALVVTLFRWRAWPAPASSAWPWSRPALPPTAWRRWRSWPLRTGRRSSTMAGRSSPTSRVSTPGRSVWASSSTWCGASWRDGSDPPGHARPR